MEDKLSNNFILRFTVSMLTMRIWQQFWPLILNAIVENIFYSSLFKTIIFHNVQGHHSLFFSRCMLHLKSIRLHKFRIKRIKTHLLLENMSDVGHLLQATPYARRVLCSGIHTISNSYVRFFLSFSSANVISWWAVTTKNTTDAFVNYVILNAFSPESRFHSARWWSWYMVMR